MYFSSGIFPSPFSLYSLSSLLSPVKFLLFPQNIDLSCHSARYEKKPPQEAFRLSVMARSTSMYVHTPCRRPLRLPAFTFSIKKPVAVIYYGQHAQLIVSSSIQTILSAPESHRIMPYGSRAVPPVGNCTLP
jgi:hypothetical protein